MEKPTNLACALPSWSKYEITRTNQFFIPSQVCMILPDLRDYGVGYITSLYRQPKVNLFSGYGLITPLNSVTETA